MPNFNAFGSISAFEAYSLEQLGSIFGESAEWARVYFIRAVDRRTKRPLIDPRTGEPLKGVPFVRLGHKVLLSGAAILRWIEEHADCLQAGDMEGISDGVA